MNPILKDPAAGVPPPLLPHLHLVSKYRYPIANNPSLETIVGHLLEAPKIVRDLQPMQWQFIESPPDGTLMLTWQPLETLGTSFASDGFIWADAEHAFKSEIRGYTLEILLQRSGYRVQQGEAMACHSRKRYRLLPGNPNLGLPHPDPSLWLVHYGRAATRDQIPSGSIPILPHVHAQIQQRRMIQSQGQLPRKEFMLYDRSNWPTIHLPPGVGRGGVPGQMPPGAAHRRGTSIAPDTTLEEEEDVSLGDILDFMTPRDISRLRYEQHHEWMEEIMESPYPTLSIMPSDLGLGRKGHLEELTKDFFDAPVSATHESRTGPPPRVGRMAAGLADDFAQRASKKLAEMEAELENMRKRHTRRIDKLKQSTTLAIAEKKLRTAPNVTERHSVSDGMSDVGSDTKPRDAVDEIMGSVETDLGKKLTNATVVTIVSKGGLKERVKTTPVVSKPAVPATFPAKATSPPVAQADKGPQQPPQAQEPPQPAVPTTESKPEVKDTSEPPRDQGLTQPTTDDKPPSSEAPEPTVDTDKQPQASADQDTDLPQLDDLGVDVNMDSLDDPGHEDGGTQDGNEWVMIGEESGPNTDMDLAAQQSENQQQQEPATAEVKAAPPNEKTTEVQQPVPAPLSNDTGLDTPDFDMGGDFDNVDVDTAGDALASYGNEDDDLNLDNMEDSAFGDAFHPEDDEDMS